MKIYKIKLKLLKILLLILFFQFSLLSIAQASEQTNLNFNRNQNSNLICQLMEMDQEIGIASPTTASSQKLANIPNIDATPIMSWLKPEQPMKAAIVCVHGLGLHKGTYHQFGERMAKEGYAIYAMDVRGFGDFQNMPGNRRCDFSKCLDDVCQALKTVSKIHPNLPIFILGESMGGAIAMRVTEEHPELLQGLISSVPGAKRYGQTRGELKVGFSIITGGLHKELNVADTVINQSTEKQELRDEWRKDPLARFTLTPLELMQFQHFMEQNEKNASLITKTPVLMVQGVQDKLVKQSDDESLIKKIPCKDSQLVFVEHAEHLIFEEGQFDDSDIKLVSNWIQEHINSK